MDINISTCMDRADNELLLSDAIYRLSENFQIKKDMFNLPQEMTFYSAVIGHAYYAIFYSAKAYLLSKGAAIPEQGQHNAVYQNFKKFTRAGELNKELMSIYEDAKVKAEILFSILESEEEKRTRFTYKALPQANKEPAGKSIENARFFVAHIKTFLSHLQ